MKASNFYLPVLPSIPVIKLEHTSESWTTYTALQELLLTGFIRTSTGLTQLQRPFQWLV